MANADELSGLVEILEKRNFDSEYCIALQQIMAKDFEKAIPYLREYLDLDRPRYPRAIDVPLIERLDKVGYEKFLEDLVRVTDGIEWREEKLKDSIPRVIQASEIYDQEKVDWLLAKRYC
jgi:hypothetical protein